MTHLIWPTIALLAILALWHRIPDIAQAVRPQFVTVYDSTLFDHTRGRWDIESGIKVK